MPDQFLCPDTDQPCRFGNFCKINAELNATGMNKAAYVGLPTETFDGLQEESCSNKRLDILLQAADNGELEQAVWMQALEALNGQIFARHMNLQR